MVRTFTGGRPPRNEMDEQKDVQLSKPGLNDFRPMPRNLFVGGIEQDQLSETEEDERTPTGYATQPEQFQVPTGTRQRHSRPYNPQHERPERSTEPARTAELEERTRVLEMAMGKILARLIPDDPLIPLLNRDAQPAAVVATRNSPALSNVVVPTKPRGSGRLNNEPSSSKHSEELIRKNADLERQLRDVQKSIDELKSPRSHQQTLDLDSAPLNLSITAEPYQEGFKIPHLETYDGSGNPDEHLHTYQAIMRIQNANDAMMCKVFPATLKSIARRWYHKLPRHSIDSYSKLAKLFSNKFASQREIKRMATELMSVSFILSEDFQSSKRRADDKQSKGNEQLPRREEKKKQKGYDRPQGQRYQLGNTQDMYQDNQYPSEQGRAYRGCQFNRRGQGQIPATQNQKDRRGVGCSVIPPPSGTINMISGGMHSRGQSARTRKAYARMAYVSFLVVKMESAFNAILGRVTLCELKAVISQPHLCMKFPTPQGVGVLRGNQKMARACYQDTFKKVELAAALGGSFESSRPTQPDKQTMSLSDIEYRPEGVEQKVEPVEPVETVHLNPDVPERTVKIGTKLTEEEQAELLEFLRVNQDVFAWTMDEMLGIPAELTVHKLSTDPSRRLMVQKRRLFGTEKQAAIDDEIQKLLQAGFIKRACPKDPHPLPNVEKLVERAAGHERMSFLDASSGYHQVQLLLDDQEKTAFYAGDAIYCYVMMPFGLKNAGATYQKLAFDELKQYLALAPLLSKPVEGESLYQYLGVTKEAVSSVLLREENKNHKPICYVSKVLQDCCLYRSTVEKDTVEAGTLWLAHRMECRVKQVLYVDGAANVEGLGAEAVLVGPDGFKSEHALRFKFQTTNNATEYEALIYGLKLASELKVQSIQVFSDSQLVMGQVNDSCEIRDPQLSRYASVDLNLQRSTIVEVLDAPSYTDFIVDCQLLSTNPSSSSWTTLLMNYLRSGELPEDSSTAKLVRRRAAHFTLIDNQLYKRAASMPLLRCLTPYEVEYAVREVYEGVCGTHMGGKTLAQKLLRHGYYWPTMVEDAQDYVKKCSTCQFNADDIHMPGEMLSSLSSPWPFAQWGVDLLGPFVKGKGGCTYLVVAVDYFTKWIEAKPLSTTTGKKIEEFLFNSILCRSFCNNYGIELALISVYTPQSNGQAKSANKIVLRGLKTRVSDAHSNWVDELNKVLWSCRTTPSSATGETPFSLAYGVEVVIPVEVGLSSGRPGQHDDHNNEQLLRENLDLVEEVREMSRIRNMAYQGRVAKFYNKRVRARQFQVGDLVLCKAGLTNTYSHMAKLAPNWEGPYMVAQVNRPGSYILVNMNGR
ncbi:hypothetical protein SLEP1_g38016 [Rubroshorea leprosula]|uniref:Uncharacterized protein n=1 Tax=Rubroshorea leprosula TaxID=152421 RepID=A0AAV5KWX9_9ROSI|nr:hypothetical protein SLEP1_g38016 [Rubroshorea leprosula]